MTKKSEFLFPVDLPFLNLSQCTQATLDNQSALVSLMLGSSNSFSTKTNPEKVSKGIHTLFSKSKAQSSDGSVLQTPFIAGIGYKPIKVSPDVYTVFEKSASVYYGGLGIRCRDCLLGLDSF